MFIHRPPKTIPNLESVTQEDGKRFYTLPSGKKVPSVTTVIGAKKKAAIMSWRKRVGEEEANRVSRHASSRGNKVHLLAEKYINNENVVTKDEMPDVASMFRSIVPEIKKINNVHYQEQSLWSEKLEMAGRVDCIAEYDGVLSVIDFKTSSKIKKKEDIPDYFAQCVCYATMYEELIGTPINQIVVIMAVQESEPLVFIEKTEDHIDNLTAHIKFYKDSLDKKSRMQ